MGTPSYEDIFKNVILPSYQQGIGQLSEAPNMANLFSSAKRNVMTQMSASRASARGRMAGNAGVPETTFLPIESIFSQAMGNIGQQEAETAYQDPFRRSGAIGQLASGLGGQSSAFFDFQRAGESPSFLDWFGTFLNAGADVAGKAAGAPRTNIMTA